MLLPCELSVSGLPVIVAVALVPAPGSMLISPSVVDTVTVPELETEEAAPDPVPPCSVISPGAFAKIVTAPVLPFVMLAVAFVPEPPTKAICPPDVTFTGLVPALTIDETALLPVPPVSDRAPANVTLTVPLVVVLNFALQMADPVPIIVVAPPVNDAAP